MKGKKIIVAGGLGFIGSHLVKKLRERNIVTIVDNESTGKTKNIGHCVGPGLEIIKGDMTKLDLTELFKDHDYVFHLAALSSDPRSVNDPLASYEANVTGTLRVLVAAKESNVKKVIFASSSFVYGDAGVLPRRETMPFNPVSPYAVTKATGKLHCNVFYEVYGLPTVSLRYFNVFGPRQDPTSSYAAAIPWFITAMLSDSPPVVYGDGLQSRDFTFIRHVVNANILACGSMHTGAYNIACGRSVTINDLIALINEILDTSIEPQYVAPRKGDVEQSYADISKARSFGYEPDSNFKQELTDTIRWFKHEFVTTR